MLENKKNKASLICTYRYESKETAASVCAAFIEEGFAAKLTKVDSDEWSNIELVKKTEEGDPIPACICHTGTRWHVTVELTGRECVDLASAAILQKKVEFEKRIQDTKFEKSIMMQEIEDLKHRLKKFEQRD